MSTSSNVDDDLNIAHEKLTLLPSISSTASSSFHEDNKHYVSTHSLTDFMNTEKTILRPTTESDMIKSLITLNENSTDKSSLFRSLIEHTEPTVNAEKLTEHISSFNQEKQHKQIDEHYLLRPFSECVEQYYRILYRVCECTEELKQELRQVKSERDQMRRRFD